MTPGRPRVAVLGAGGYAGGELLRILLGHPGVDLVLAGSRTHAGKPLEAAHPNLVGASPLSFVDARPAEAAEAARVVFLALGHGESIAAVSEIVARAKDESVIVDLSGDFRLPPGDYDRAYGRKHEAPDLIPSFVYGCAELSKGELAGARRISNPGCFATGAALAVAPLAVSGQLRGMLVVNGVTGASGSGVSPSAGTHFPARDGNFKAYKVLAHQHEPEILQALERLARGGSAAREPAGPRARTFELVFTAHSAPLTRGIHTTATLELAAATDVLGLYRKFYEGARFVRVGDRPVELKGLAGTNRVEIGVAVRGRYAVVTCALDNLVKGAAGQAVQNMNLALGLDEGLGLGFTALYP